MGARAIPLIDCLDACLVGAGLTVEFAFASAVEVATIAATSAATAAATLSPGLFEISAVASAFNQCAVLSASVLAISAVVPLLTVPGAISTRFEIAAAFAL